MAAPTDTPVDHALAWVMEPTSVAQWLTILPVGLCLGIAAALMMIRHQTRLHAPIAIACLALVVAVELWLLAIVAAQGPVTMMMGRWLPPFGIAFTVDMMGVLFALAAGLVSLAGAIHATGTISESNRRYGFFPFLLVLTAGVSGAFLTGDIFNLYVWFEVLLIASFGLLILGSEHEQIDGALKYAILNLVATTLFLIGVGYLYAIFGTLNMADIATKAAAMSETAPLLTLSALFVFAFAMKAAAFPVNFWLPASYHTPRVVVSALFGGLLTKVGVYALLRVMVMLFPVEREMLSLVIAVVASLTMLIGALGALAQTDMRRFLGFVVISGIGYVIAGVAMGTQTALTGAIFYALHSIVLMTALYLLSGIAASIGGSFSMVGLGGLYARAPFFAALALALFFAASGLPPFSGFWPKAMLVKAAIDIGAWWLAGSVLVSGFLLTIAFGRLFLFAFWRPGSVEDQARTVRFSWIELAPVLMLTVPIVWFGLFPERLIDWSQQAAAGIADPRAYIQSVFGEAK